MRADQTGNSLASVPCTCLTDYLVICVRASARPMDPANATLERPLDSSENIISQLYLPAQRTPVHGLVCQLGSLRWYVRQRGRYNPV